MEDRSHARAHRLRGKDIDRVRKTDDGIRARSIRRAHDRPRIARILHAVEHDSKQLAAPRQGFETRRTRFQHEKDSLRRLGVARLPIDLGRHRKERTATSLQLFQDALHALFSRRFFRDEAKAQRPARLRRHLDEPHALSDNDAFRPASPRALQAREPFDLLVLRTLDLFHHASLEITALSPR